MDDDNLEVKKLREVTGRKEVTEQHHLAVEPLTICSKRMIRYRQEDAEHRDINAMESGHHMNHSADSHFPFIRRAELICQTS
ncbi:hypothetical protein [Microbacter margulisiae]|uniref:Uncharacterized protein n=1 Tax=Microbacter margulisiae TaxID=1350067 RepID=A0A7W5H1Z5_9PORP|nr:hypothetical protein [Microbacter margulisiae]MBB3187190.1 hypothetical protein [Microbacter margulisiae]